MQLMLMICQMAACRDLIRCTVHRLCVDIPRDLRAAACTDPQWGRVAEALCRRALRSVRSAQSLAVRWMPRPRKNKLSFICRFAAAPFDWMSAKDADQKMEFERCSTC